MVNSTKFQNIYEITKGKNKKTLLTKNLVPGVTVYDERLIKDNNQEYREWNQRRSKLASAILKGIREIGIKKGSTVLYLGASYGTTPSHVSDIVRKEGFIFALDSAPRVVRELVFLCEERTNMTPLLEDANHPENYKDKVTEVDIIYQDIAQKNQTEIFLKNIDLFLKKDGHALVAIKARSIDVTKKPKEIFNKVRKELEKHLKIIDFKDLYPFEKDHMFFVCKKR